jgi:DNA (cytosine-5)-methyltransferase 1
VSQKEVANSNNKHRLEVSAVLWPTPRAQEPGSTSSDHGLCLREVSQQWATPTARDWKDGAMLNTTVPTKSLLSRQAPRIMVDGGASSSNGRTLNPLFVEVLMGWPIGWTGSGSVATAWCRWLPLMRSMFFQLKQNYSPEHS